MHEVGGRQSQGYEHGSLVRRGRLRYCCFVFLVERRVCHSADEEPYQPVVVLVVAPVVVGAAGGPAARHSWPGDAGPRSSRGGGTRAGIPACRAGRCPAPLHSHVVIRLGRILQQQALVVGLLLRIAVVVDVQGGEVDLVAVLADDGIDEPHLFSVVMLGISYLIHRGCI